uniref:C2 domain-containing protein n=1 Tax=Heterorhabditis bacteriophora TaxID=37862 RepID=A0A1I7WYF3_HETBA
MEKLFVNVCIKITVVQGTKTQTKSSRVLKSTTTAVYNEAVMFLFNPSKSEVENTKITISVHDMQRSVFYILR